MPRVQVSAVRRELEIFHGHQVKTTGGGFHAIFDGPARAVQFANTIRQSTRQLGLSLRIGKHTGECEIQGESLEGVAIHMAARVSAMATCGDIFVSRTVKDLVAGSGNEFENFGTYELKGIPDKHQIFKVVATWLSLADTQNAEFRGNLRPGADTQELYAKG